MLFLYFFLRNLRLSANYAEFVVLLQICLPDTNFKIIRVCQSDVFSNKLKVSLFDRYDSNNNMLGNPVLHAMRSLFPRKERLIFCIFIYLLALTYYVNMLYTRLPKCVSETLFSVTLDPT